MKAFEIKTYGDPNGLSLADRPSLSPAPGQVLVRIRAVSLNYRDLVVVRGEYDRKPQIGRIPCSDGAGEVVAVGAGVSQFKPGDRVAGCFFQAWIGGRFKAEYHRSALGGAIDGVLAEEVLFEQDGLVHLPELYSFEEGATLPCAALTAWQSLFVRGGLTTGESVLLLGTGGVSIFGLQFAKAAGAKAIITSSSDEKLKRARQLGADEVINYRSTPEWGKAAAHLSGVDGVDHVIEVGGAGTFQQSVRACRFNGNIGLIGILSGREAETEIFSIVPKGLNVFGIYVGSRWMFEDMNRALTQNRLKPVIDRVFPFTEAPDAFRYLASGAHFGKVVISV
jgi:NADPH:quinone reductase-like Zn-dependent oxidoreductase